jgi:dipeptidyl aminopeptidase/acylaminoacyl peptidase
VRPWLALTLIGVSLSAAAQTAPPLSVRALFANPLYSSPRLSADGKTFAVIRSEGDRQLVVTRGVKEGRPTAVAKIDDPDTRLAWLRWANADRLLISAQKRDRNAMGMRARATRLFGVNRDGKDFDWLGRRWPLFGSLEIPVQYQDQVVHLTPADPGGVLLWFLPPIDQAPKVMRMDVDTGALQTEQIATHFIRQWHADAAGRVRAGEAVSKTNQYQVWARIDPAGELEEVIEHDVWDPRGASFEGFHADPAKLYVSALHEGREALFEFDLRTKSLGALVYAHPEVDVAGVQHDAGPEERAVGARFTVDRPEILFFDEAAEREHLALRRALERELGTPVFHEPVSASVDGTQQILEASSDVQPPVYYHFDRTEKRLTRLLDERPEIQRGQLSRTERVTYKARDGLPIPAYLTLPRAGTARPLPTIALVHGGPWARDAIEWNPEVQLFANHGFAVLQMNYRGSTGFGRKHLEAGYREWGQKIQDDITDGVRWLVDQGVADPDRIGIYGSSFGGYASLVGLVKTPDLYRAGAAYAAVTDIELLLGDDKYYEWIGSAEDWHETMVGGGSDDAQRLRESSPVRRASEIRVPVLLGHGVDDERVHVRQSQRMAKALRDAGKPVEYLEFPDEIHGFLLEANRIRWYEALIAFFEKNLAPRASPAPSAS